MRRVLWDFSLQVADASLAVAFFFASDVCL
jgi:hypothetical protein